MAITRFGGYLRPVSPVFGNQRKQPAEPSVPKVDAEAAKLLSGIAEMRTHAFREKFQKVINEAKAYLEIYLQNREAAKSAVALDIDETILDGTALDLMKLATGEPGGLAHYKWVQRADAPAIPETLEFVKWALDKGFKLFFISARREKHREATVRNLEKIGLKPSQYGLYLRPKDDTSATASDFKVAAQRDIERKGLKVAMMMGDQDSDLKGALGKPFKLPNPLYSVD